MLMTSVIIISLAAVLLASQIAVIIALVVLCKKFKTLKEEVHKYKIKKNRESLSALVVKTPKEKENRPRNEYVDGKRQPSTLVKTNSKESIVYVPTPAPERRSKNYGDQENAGFELNDMQSCYNEAVNVYPSNTQDEDEEIYGNQVVIDMHENGGEADQTLCGTNNDPSTPCIEEIDIRSGYVQDQEEIYSNQVAIDMAEGNTAGLDSASNVQTNTPKNVNTKSKKSKHQTRGQRGSSRKCKTSIESERTMETEAGDSFCEGDINDDVINEPIYMNLGEQKASTMA